MAYTPATSPIGSSSTSSDSYRPVPGDIEIGSAVLMNFDKSEKWDLRHIALEISLYESLSSDHMRADILLADALALTTRMPIIGEEILQLKVRTPNTTDAVNNKWIEVTMAVVRMDRLDPTNIRAGRYQLTAISAAGLANLPQIIAKSFGPAKITDMVRQICQQYLGVSGDKLGVEESEGLHKFAIPYKSPFQAIHFLAREAKVRAGKASDYIFYEDHERLNFRTLQSLLIQPPAITYYVTEQSLPSPGGSGGTATPPSSGGTIDPRFPDKNPVEWRYVSNLSIKQGFDVEKGILGGLYDNTVWTIDPVQQKFKPVYVDHKRGFMLYDQHFPLFNQTFERRPNKLHSPVAPMMKFKGTSHIRYLITNKEQNERKLQITHRARPDALPLNVSSMQQANFIVAELTIPGDSNRKCGDVIHFDLHEFGATDDVVGQINKYISGGWLITAVRHKMTFNGYFSTHLEVAKTAYENQIERAK